MYKDSDPTGDWGVVHTDDFAVSPEHKHRIFVIDDFYTNPHELRKFAVNQWYYDDEGFEGLRTRKQFFFKGVALQNLSVQHRGNFFSTFHTRTNINSCQ